MNFDVTKNTLLEIIKEANNLPESELEVIPGTQVKVKKGRTKEFDVNAYYYFEYKNNVKITEEIDYVTQIYDYLNKQMREENEEYYISEAYETVKFAKDEIVRFNKLKDTLFSINKNFYLKRKELDKHLSVNNTTAEWENTFNELTSSINETVKNKNYIEDQLIDIKKTLNGNLISKLNEQMEVLRNDYSTTKLGTEIDFGLDGHSILKKDKEQYDTLYSLKVILNNNDFDVNSLVSYSDTMIISENQKDEVEKLVANIDLFKVINAPKVEIKNQEIKRVVEIDPNEKKKMQNENLINELNNYLKALESKYNEYGGYSNIPAKLTNNKVAVLVGDCEEYNRILEIINLLKNSSVGLVNVWGIGNVKYDQVQNFKLKVNKIKYFQDKIPVISENISIMNEVKNRMTELNETAKATKNPILGNSGVVLADNEEEYQILVDKFKMLEAAKFSSNLVEVDGAKIDYNSASTYKDLNEKLAKINSAVKSEPVVALSPSEPIQYEEISLNDHEDIQLQPEEENELSEEYKPKRLVNEPSMSAEEYIPKRLIEGENSRNFKYKPKRVVRKRKLKDLKSSCVDAIKRNWNKIFKKGLQTQNVENSLQYGNYEGYIPNNLTQTDLINFKIKFDAANQRYSEQVDPDIAKGIIWSEDVEEVSEELETPVITIPSNEEIFDNFTTNSVDNLRNEAEEIQAKLDNLDIPTNERLELSEKLKRINEEIDNIQKNERGL